MQPLTHRKPHMSSIDSFLDCVVSNANAAHTLCIRGEGTNIAVGRSLSTAHLRLSWWGDSANDSTALSINSPFGGRCVPPNLVVYSLLGVEVRVLYPATKIPPPPCSPTRCPVSVAAGLAWTYSIESPLALRFALRPFPVRLCLLSGSCVATFPAPVTTAPCFVSRSCRENVIYICSAGQSGRAVLGPVPWSRGTGAGTVRIACSETLRNGSAPRLTHHVSFLVRWWPFPRLLQPRGRTRPEEFKAQRANGRSFSSAPPAVFVFNRAGWESPDALASVAFQTVLFRRLSWITAVVGCPATRSPPRKVYSIR